MEGVDEAALDGDDPGVVLLLQRVRGSLVFARVFGLLVLLLLGLAARLTVVPFVPALALALVLALVLAVRDSFQDSLCVFEDL